MKKNKNLIKISLLFLIFLNACGFSKIYNQNEELFTINEITSKGEGKIGHNLKNEILLYSSKKSTNLINLNLNVEKIKTVKERTVTKKTTKYNIVIRVNLGIENTTNGEKIKQVFTKSVDYDAGKNQSDTISNEKKSTENITDLIAEQITNYLILYFKNQ
jgi:hypothetical protein